MAKAKRKKKYVHRATSNARKRSRAKKEPVRGGEVTGNAAVHARAPVFASPPAARETQPVFLWECKATLMKMAEYIAGGLIGVRSTVPF